MEYASNSLQGSTIGGVAAQRLNQPTPELGRLKHAAERISIASDRVGSFLGRFNGMFQAPGVATSNAAPVADGYRNDLESVFAQLERLEQAVSALDCIG